jgi:hypothetical protein
MRGDRAARQVRQRGRQPEVLMDSHQAFHAEPGTDPARRGHHAKLELPRKAPFVILRAGAGEQWALQGRLAPDVKRARRKRTGHEKCQQDEQEPGHMAMLFARHRRLQMKTSKEFWLLRCFRVVN